ncbi:hypothetical protein HOK51_08835 [Candidatus Woesearchaeota archaeon]|jgi:hypothetical protein|nr:hypothetical protein [Candidatus Woesearchaeota archaeon]MBT6519933.1 hypothetical protein [Candidatus Woesearchaeota archaeon]MBT7367091.1 hypothetical protein [Candidatus Woesearchaeota archaeon]
MSVLSEEGKIAELQKFVDEKSQLISKFLNVNYIQFKAGRIEKTSVKPEFDQELFKTEIDQKTNSDALHKPKLGTIIAQYRPLNKDNIIEFPNETEKKDIKPEHFVHEVFHGYHFNLNKSMKEFIRSYAQQHETALNNSVLEKNFKPLTDHLNCALSMHAAAEYIAHYFVELFYDSEHIIEITPHEIEFRTHLINQKNLKNPFRLPNNEEDLVLQNSAKKFNIPNPTDYNLFTKNEVILLATHAHNGVNKVDSNSIINAFNLKLGKIHALTSFFGTNMLQYDPAKCDIELINIETHSDGIVGVCNVKNLNLATNEEIKKYALSEFYGKFSDLSDRLIGANSPGGRGYELIINTLN